MLRVFVNAWGHLQICVQCLGCPSIQPFTALSSHNLALSKQQGYFWPMFVMDLLASPGSVFLCVPVLGRILP